MSMPHLVRPGFRAQAYKPVQARSIALGGLAAQALVCGLLLSLALAGAPACASVTYQFTGSPLNYTPPPSFFPPGQPPLPPPPSLFGNFVFGTAVFDDTVVTADFTGTLSAGFAATLGTNLLPQTSANVDFMRGFPPVFTFSQGQIIGWNLLATFTLLPGIANYSVPMHSSNVGDSFSPLTGGLVLGTAGSAAGQWTRVTPPAAVPLPASLPLLLAGLSAMAACRRKTR
jgi:hypothetical protein